MEDRRTVNVGVVGAGTMGSRHARVYSGMHGTRLTGVYGPDTNRAVDLAARYGGTVFHSLEDLLANVDAVSIASIATSHADVAIRTMDANVHQLIEKPLAASLCEARSIAEHARRHRDLIVMVGHIERFNPTLPVLKRVLAGNEVRSVTSRRTTMAEHRVLDTDVVHDLMIHDIDLILDLIGDEINAVDAQGSIIYSGFVDTAVVQFEMDSDIRTTLIASRAAQREVREIIVAVDDGVIVADLLRKAIRFQTAAGVSDQGHLWKVPQEDPLTCELSHFVSCVQSGQKPGVDVECGYRSLIYADAVTNLIHRGLARQAATRAARHENPLGVSQNGTTWARGLARPH